MNLIVGFLANILLALFLLPWVKRFQEKKAQRLETVVFSFGISVGMGTLLIFYILLLYPLLFNTYFLIPMLFAVFIIGFLLFRKNNPTYKLKNIRVQVIRYFSINQLFSFESILWFLFCLFALYVIIDSLYKPIFEWDTLARYAYWGNRMFTLKQIDSVEVQYPLLIPITLAYSFLTSGGYNDYLAKIIPALFSIFSPLATYLLGKELFNKKAGLVSALFLAGTPLFIFWSTRVYIDIPQMFYTVLFLYSIYKYFDKGKVNYAGFAGLFLALALWSKQSAAISFVTILPFMLTIYLGNKYQLFNRKIPFSLKAISLLIIPSIVLVGYWYIRNIMLGGRLVDEGYKLSSRTVYELFPFVKHPDSFSYFLGSLYFIGFIFCFFKIFDAANKKNIKIKLVGILLLLLALINSAAHFILSKPPGLFSRYIIIIFAIIGIFELFNKSKMSAVFNWKMLLFFVFIVPYHLLVWWNYNYDTRFWIPLLPFWSVMGASVVVYFIENYLRRVEVELIFLLLIAFLFMPVGYQLIGHEFFLYPAKSDYEKKSIYIGDGYQPFLQLKALTLPTDTLVLAHDNRVAGLVPQLRYFRDTPTALSEVKKYDYFLVSNFTTHFYQQNNSLNNEVLINLNNNLYFEKIFRSEDGKQSLYKIIK